MSPVWVFLAYGVSFVAAVLLLYFFRARHWYWHVLSVAAALTIGLMPAPPYINGAFRDLLTGTAFVLLFVWGVGAPFFRPAHAHQPAKASSASA